MQIIPLLCFLSCCIRSRPRTTDPGGWWRYASHDYACDRRSYEDTHSREQFGNIGPGQNEGQPETPRDGVAYDVKGYDRPFTDPLDYYLHSITSSTDFPILNAWLHN